VIEYSTTAQIHDSQIISSTLINQFSASLSRMFIPLTSNTYGGNYPSKAGLKGLPGGVAGSGFPDITFSGGINLPVSWLGTNSHAYNEAQNTYDVQDNVLWTKGKHNLTFGFQWQSLQDNENTPLTGTQAGFTFSNAETENFSNNTAVANTGLAYAGFLLGAVDSSAVTQNAVAETGGRYKTYAFYVQDDYKVSKHLTVNLGLRWNIWSTFTEVNNVMSFFNPTMPNPAAGNIPGALEFAGSGTDSCHCSTPVKQHNVNPGPRVGLAYQLGEKTVIRASYSIFYSHAGGVGGRTNGRQGLSQLGFNNNGSLSSAVTGQPAYNWNSGYPGYPLNPPFFYPSFGIGYITAAAAASLPYPAGPTTAQTITYGDPNFGGKAPYYENWSFNIQRSLTPNWMLSLAYSASAGHWLPGAAVAGPMTNQIPVRYLPLGSLLTSTLSASTLAQAQAIFPNIAIPFPNFTGTIGQAVKPFPQYNGISDPWLDIGNSTYNALQISVNHRFAAGLSVMFNYAYSKELDDLVGVRDPNKDFLEKGPGTIDHPSVASATFVYQLPFGKGHKLSAGVLNPVVGHWQISGLFTYQGGAPLSITGTCTGGGIIDASCYPNYATGFSGSVWQNGTIGSGGANVSSTVYLNKAAFVDPAAYTVGNITRAAPYGLFAPHNADVDLSVRREFPIRERIRLLFQADAFNVNNAVHFAAPGLGIDSSTFGIVSSMANSPRKLQFGARLSF
jgi:outer membrane receptor protein involved in Fe transport